MRTVTQQDARNLCIQHGFTLETLHDWEEQLLGVELRDSYPFETMRMALGY